MKHVKFKLKRYSEEMECLGVLEDLEESIDLFIFNYEEKIREEDFSKFKEVLTILSKIGDATRNTCRSFENTLVELLEYSERNE